MRGRGIAYTLTEQIRRQTQNWEKFAVYGQKQLFKHDYSFTGLYALQYADSCRNIRSGPQPHIISVSYYRVYALPLPFQPENFSQTAVNLLLWERNKQLSPGHSPMSYSTKTPTYALTMNPTSMPEITLSQTLTAGSIPR